MLETVFKNEQSRIVHLASLLTGSPDAAEDIAQEVFFEAWKNRHKLVEPEGASRWISVITRNVCKRWQRSQAKVPNIISVSNDVEDPLDSLTDVGGSLEDEIDHTELVNLLDSALAHMPRDTRAALVLRYVMEMPQAEVADRLKLTEGAIEARLQRGKNRLKYLLASNYHEEASAFGLLQNDTHGWVKTRLWCPDCGLHHLFGTLPRFSGQFELHCPACSWQPYSFFAQSNIIKDFEGVKGFRATLKRFEDYIFNLFAGRANAANLPCQTCGHSVPIQFELPASIHSHYHHQSGNLGIFLDCPHCGRTAYSDIYGLALNQPNGRQFWQAHPRMRTLPPKLINFHGQSAWLVKLESLTDNRTQDIVLSKNRYISLN